MYSKDKNKRNLQIICDVTIAILLILTVLVGIKAYGSYKLCGFGHPVKTTDPLSGHEELLCFNSSEAKIEYLESLQRPQINGDSFIKDNYTYNISVS